MRPGFVGVGRMRANAVQRLTAGGHRAVAYDWSPEATAAAASHSARGVHTLEALIAALPLPRALWLMVPAARQSTRRSSRSCRSSRAAMFSSTRQVLRPGLSWVEHALRGGKAFLPATSRPLPHVTGGGVPHPALEAVRAADAAHVGIGFKGAEEPTGEEG